jgi:putative FmdB family regulatory protein
MPIYEYEALSPDSSCQECRQGFEVLQRINEEPLLTCPNCGKKVRKVISWCRSLVVESCGEQVRVERKINEYEKSGRYSHAAELADKHSEKTNDRDLKVRALENYKKAGYDADSLTKHSKPNND